MLALDDLTEMSRYVFTEKNIKKTHKKTNNILYLLVVAYDKVKVKIVLFSNVGDE